MSTGRVPGPLTLLARRHGLVRSPLRRTTDRWEGAVGPHRARVEPSNLAVTNRTNNEGGAEDARL
jgi:hypothetical protein